MARRSVRVAGRRGNGRGRGEAQLNARPNVQDNNLDNAQLAALVNQAVNQALPQLVAQVVQAMQQQQQPPENPDQGNPENGGPQANEEEGNANGIDQLVVPTYVWLERFQKQKPHSFSSAPTPIEAANWIAHLEKIFDVLGCSDNQRVLLAAYKLDGDAQRWWKAIKATKGDRFVETLTWAEFCDVFYQQYFSAADKEAYGREFLSIQQKDDESITDFMTRFTRLAGFAGTSAGTTTEQAEKFKWKIHYKYRQHLINTKFEDVSAVANAAKNIEMEQQDFQASKPEGSRKRDRDDQQGQVVGQHGRNQSGQWNRNRGGQQRQNQGRYPGPAGGGNPNLIPIAPCATCGANHPGRPCYRVTGACFLCGQIGHFAKDCTGPRGNGGGNNGGNVGQRNGGRVFALAYNQAAGAPGTVSRHSFSWQS